MFEHHTQEHYSVLGVAPTATRDEIRRAWREAAKFWHPDRNDLPEATSKLKALNVAWDVLSDSQRRAQYDALLSAGVLEFEGAAAGASGAGGGRSQGNRGGRHGGGDARWGAGQSHRAGSDGWSRTHGQRRRPDARAGGHGSGSGSSRRYGQGYRSGSNQRSGQGSGAGSGYSSGQGYRSGSGSSQSSGQGYGYSGYRPPTDAGFGDYSDESPPDFVRMWNALKLEANLREGREPDYPGIIAAPRIVGYGLLGAIILGLIGSAITGGNGIAALIGLLIGLVVGVAFGSSSATRAERRRVARATGYPEDVITMIHAQAQVAESGQAWNNARGR